jgi:ABC-type antimicrobial peptide transport system permease subunit
VKDAADEMLYPRRLAAAVAGLAGLTSLILASIGLYGIVSYSIAQRTREIGVRAALGADRRDIIMLILREGAGVVALGCAFGLGLTYLVMSATAKFVVALPSIHVAAIVWVPALIGTVVLVACYLPARRAARTDPMAALRTL